MMMNKKQVRKFLVTGLMAILSVSAMPLMAQNKFPADAAGSSDHPLIKRFTGSALIGYKVSEWEQTVFPVGMKTQDKKVMEESVSLEGKITRLYYLAPTGKARLEVFRNYEQALVGAGLKKKFACEKDCAYLFFAWSHDNHHENGVKWTTGKIPTADGKNSFSAVSPLNFDGRFLYGTIARGEQELHVLLYSSVAADNTTDATATYIEIVEPKAMKTGQVTVDAKAMQAGLQADGKMALYGIYFDTGKADIKPESKGQLDEMAKLLQSQAGMKVYIVGHTDNQGSLESNLTLSQQRAQAVVAALSAAPYKIDAKRLMGKGVASLAPVASNASDEGRARNRRVELVLQ